MSYDRLFITKGGVTLHILLCDNPTTLMTLHLLYDCYIQQLTLHIHLKWLNITMHMFSCEMTWLEQALQDIANTLSTLVRLVLWHACDGEARELMPSLVVCDGVHVSHRDIFLKRTLWYSWTRKKLMYNARADLQVCTSDHAHPLFEVHV